MKNKILIGTLVAGVLLLGGAAAWASSDYQSWRSAMGNRAPRVTEENFEKFSQMQKMMVEGDYAGAQKIRTDLGFGQGRNGGKGGGCGMRGNGGCPMAGGSGAGFVDKNANGICDFHENLQ